MAPGLHRRHREKCDSFQSLGLVYSTGKAAISYPKRDRPVTRSVTLHPASPSRCTPPVGIVRFVSHNGTSHNLKAPIGDAPSSNSPSFGFLRVVKSKNNLVPRCSRRGRKGTRSRCSRTRNNLECSNSDISSTVRRPATISRTPHRSNCLATSGYVCRMILRT
ncbi:hypothetical protein EDB87DRAFT_1337764 [Lactarius vividus]|nr:hypothetical protein EDB87DRAFT_1337764 [Lactarius vividus]